MAEATETLRRTVAKARRLLNDADPFALSPVERALKRLANAVAVVQARAREQRRQMIPKAGGDLTLGDLRKLTKRAEATERGARRYQREVLRDQIAKAMPKQKGEALNALVERERQPGETYSDALRRVARTPEGQAARRQED